ncbi:MAG: DNA topoisomerase VI subunit B, partial [Methanomethylophilus sp.]
IKAVADVDWRRYGLEQRGGKGVPFGPAIILVHVASTKVPFTSEGKEAIAALPEIQNEIELALKLCARNLKSHLNKKEQKAKTHEKFEIVQQILPDLANKSAEQLHRPVPDLARTIIRIMNVVWVEPGTIKENSARKITYTVFNYTNKARTFMLHAQLPPECSSPDLKKSNLFDSANNEGKTQWLIKDLQPAKSVQIVFTLAGDLADTFDPDDVYVSGISPLVVMGAEALPGDWGIRGLAITEEDETVLENDTAAEAEEQQEEKEEEDFDREEKDDYC